MSVMTGEVLKREVASRRGPIAALAGALSILSFGALGAASGLEDTITDITESFPETLSAFIPADVPGGYVVGEVFNLIAPLALIAFTVMAAANCVAGEEESGTMSVLASHPVSRQSILGQKAAGIAAGLIGVAVVFAGVALLAEGAFDIGLTAEGIIASTIHLVLLTLTFGGVALAVAALTGSPSLAAAAGGGLAAIAYVSDAMLPLADLDTWARLSPWYYYASSVPLANGFDVGHALVLLVSIAAMYVVAAVGFQRRDLKG